MMYGKINLKVIHELKNKILNEDSNHIQKVYHTNNLVTLLGVLY